MEVKKLQLPGFEGWSIADGSYRLFKYKQQKSDKELLEIEKRPCWPTPGFYHLKVNLPPQREVEAVIVIIKTSANCFKIMYSDKSKSELVIVKNYKEINDYFVQLFKPAAVTPSPPSDEEYDDEFYDDEFYDDDE